MDITGLWGNDITEQYKNIVPIAKNIYICCGLDTIQYHFTDGIFSPAHKFFVIKRNKYKIKINDNRIIYLDNILNGEPEKTMSSTVIRNMTNGTNYVVY